MKLILMTLFSFIAFVKTPIGLERRYVVDSVEIVGSGQVYKLVLKGSTRVVYVPTVFTVIEESGS